MEAVQDHNSSDDINLRIKALCNVSVVCTWPVVVIKIPCN